MPVLTDPQRLQLLKLLQDQPQMSQRDLAQAMGVSLGKANYCLKALMDKGLVKFANFRRNPDKAQYAYLLTPAGLEEKTRITMDFLKRKVAEYEALEAEIEQLRGDLKNRRIQSAAAPERQTENR
jgi:EPS-associated MarR family transcriptional regulator